ncbi:hypothetical protein ANCDUO_23824 [Ancylostoma duodenale]|uniref:Uncharacterized protein n=1 Tax=Ancylostoma duodenale TaxID=51022 RepID=A0A0C2FC31_9BILA|nr:hypothetical protein ANCDUO_23824 [Ancylostoma duodenale]
METASSAFEEPFETSSLSSLTWRSTTDVAITTFDLNEGLTCEIRIIVSLDNLEDITQRSLQDSAFLSTREHHRSV